MCRVGFATVILYLLPIAAYAQRTASDAEIKTAIAKLGEGTDENGFERFEILYKDPHRAAELLISALKPVRRGQYLSGQHPQVVWNIRALRSLTGLDFRAATRADLSEEEAHFLDHDPKTDKVLFFGTWMSRDRVWVAPHDAQIAIIKKWRGWFVRHGKDFKYVDDPIADHWYF